MSSYIEHIINNEELLKQISDMAFQSVDTDKSGHIDDKELDKIMAQIASDMGAEPPTKENVKEVLKDLDGNGSGEIEPEEFTKLIKNILTALVEN